MFIFGRKFMRKFGASKISHIFTKIALNPLHTNLFHIVLSAFFLTIGIGKTHAQEIKKESQTVPPKTQTDSIAISLKEAQAKLADTIPADSIKQKKAILESKIRYKAEKYAKLDQKQKLITLYDKAELYYQDIELKSGMIVFNYEKNEVYAGRIKDSTGTLVQYPVFKQGSNIVEPDSIRFNYKTKKALIWNSRTDQGEFKVKAEVSKRINDSVYFLKGARFTTAKDIEDPEYYFYTNRIKYVPGKKVVTGLTNMVIADVPTPIALPFAFFPMTTENTSGLIIPTFGDSNQRGYFLQNGGYYFALSDHYDLAVLGDYYTNGSYAMRFESSYGWRYRFRGNFNVRFENLIQEERGFPNYAKTKIYNIQWTHSQDAKSNPNSRFSAMVNLGSSKYFEQSANSLNIGGSLINTLTSSITYHKTFNTLPLVNVDLSATHNQNTNTQEINMTLPTLQVSVDRIYPFEGKNGIRKGFFRNINLQYSGRGENRYNTTDSLFFKSEMFKNGRTGFSHSIPLSTNFKVFKYFSATMGTSYQEVWDLQTIRKYYDTTVSKDSTTTVKGFDAYRTYNFSAGLSTTIYGTFKFGDDKKIQAIRHVMNPGISYSYSPAFDQYYDQYLSDVAGQPTIKEYTRFEQAVFGAPGNNYASSVGFSLKNTFEAKVRDSDSTKTEAKKIKLLNNLTFGTTYNMAADSLKWSPMTVSGGTNILKDKMSINFGMRLDPYAIDNNGKKFNTWNIDNGGSLFRLTAANVTINYSLSSRDGDANKKENTQGLRNGGRDDDLFGTATDFSVRRESQFGDDEDDTDKFPGFFNAELPWDMTFAYQLSYTNERREKKISGNSVMVSVNTDVSPKWKVGVSTGYDFVNKGVTYTQFRFERDLLSWRMDFNWMPYSTTGSNWNFFIGIKSGVLSDIKWEKRAVNFQ